MSHPNRPDGPSLPAVLVPPTALAARLHHRVLRFRDGDRGQGTVEYVALAMLIAAVMAGVVIAGSKMGQQGGIGQAVVEKVKAAIGAAGKTPPAPGK